MEGDFALLLVKERGLTGSSTMFRQKSCPCPCPNLPKSSKKLSFNGLVDLLAQFGTTKLSVKFGTKNDVANFVKSLLIYVSSIYLDLMVKND